MTFSSCWWYSRYSPELTHLPFIEQAFMLHIVVPVTGWWEEPVWEMLVLGYMQTSTWKFIWTEYLFFHFLISLIVWLCQNAINIDICINFDPNCQLFKLFIVFYYLWEKLPTDFLGVDPALWIVSILNFHICASKIIVWKA